MHKDAKIVMQGWEELTVKGNIQDTTLAAMKKLHNNKTFINYVLGFFWFNVFSQFTVSTSEPVETERDFDKKIGKSTRPGQRIVIVRTLCDAVANSLANWYSWIDGWND